jgi:hypothetical protein
MTRNILLATLFTLGSAIVLVVIFMTEKSIRMRDVPWTCRPGHGE